MTTSTTQRQRKNVRVPDPTPEEIRLRAAEIRKTWALPDVHIQDTNKGPQK